MQTLSKGLNKKKGVSVECPFKESLTALVVFMPKLLLPYPQSGTTKCNGDAGLQKEPFLGAVYSAGPQVFVSPTQL